MKQNTFTAVIVLGLVVLAVIAFTLPPLLGTNGDPTPKTACTLEAKICPDGTAVGRTGPNCEFAACPSPVTTPTTSAPDDVQLHIDSKADLIVMDTPVRDSVVVSPITITGKARGTWFFEASFPITIVDWDGRIIGEGHAEAQSDWMTTEFVPFIANVTFAVPENTPYRRGAIILRKDNPSGLPQNDDALEIPVRF